MASLSTSLHDVALASNVGNVDKNVFDKNVFALALLCLWPVAFMAADHGPYFASCLAATEVWKLRRVSMVREYSSISLLLRIGVPLVNVGIFLDTKVSYWASMAGVITNRKFLLTWCDGDESSRAPVDMFDNCGSTLSMYIAFVRKSDSLRFCIASSALALLCLRFALALSWL